MRTIYSALSGPDRLKTRPSNWQCPLIMDAAPISGGLCWTHAAKRSEESPARPFCASLDLSVLLVSALSMCS